MVGKAAFRISQIEKAIQLESGVESCHLQEHNGKSALELINWLILYDSKEIGTKAL